MPTSKPVASTIVGAMHIPRIWTNVSADGQLPDGKVVPVSIWGWGEDERSARATAAERLKRVLERLLRGEVPDRYAYGSTPLREEILLTIESSVPGEPAGIVTRNGFGAQILNTARLLFLDVDVAAPTILQRIQRLLGGRSAENRALAALRQALQQHGRATFRIYRTASGLRALAVDREFDPTGREAQELMQLTGTDPAFARLCLVQRSFRARLTPKPWRCRTSMPPGRYPRPAGEVQVRFTEWLREYEQASKNYATCRYLETAGNGSAKGDVKNLLVLHDQQTRCDEALPLA